MLHSRRPDILNRRHLSILERPSRLGESVAPSSQVYVGASLWVQSRTAAFDPEAMKALVGPVEVGPLVEAVLEEEDMELVEISFRTTIFAGGEPSDDDLLTALRPALGWLKMKDRAQFVQLDRAGFSAVLMVWGSGRRIPAELRSEVARLGIGLYFVEF